MVKKRAPLDINVDRLESIASQAAKIVMEYYKPGMQVECKDDHSPVTLADKAAHHFIVSELTQSFPHIPIISEESLEIVSYEERKLWPLFFLVDPLDGTKEFIRFNDEFTVNIALVENGKPIVGVIHHPVEQCSFIAQKGLGVQKIQAGVRSDLGKRSESLSTLDKIQSIGSRSHAGAEMDWLHDQYPNAQILDPIKMGSSWKFCMVADQQADIYIRLKPTCEWDIAAGQIIVEEAGCEFLRLDTMTVMNYNKESLVNPGFVVRRS